MKFDARKAYRHLETLAGSIGPRPGGSHEEHLAAEYLLRHFRTIGLKAELEAFDVEVPGTTDAELWVDGLGEIACNPVAATRSTPTRGLDGEIVFVESGEEVYLTPSCTGKVLLVYGELGTPDKYEQLMRVKPAAIILAENMKFLAPRLTKLAEEKRSRFGAVPTIRISFEAADQILRARRQKCRIRVKVSHERGTSHNVCATLTGTEKPHEIVVIGGHYDSVWGGSGAQDNAGGVAVVMELARVFGMRGSKRTMKFCCFGSEELGLRGSTAYVRTLLAEDKRHQRSRQKEGWMLRTSALEQHRLMLNVDLQGLLMGENYCPVGGPEDLVAAVRLLAAEIGPAFKFDGECYSSDNAPFANVGVPTASFGRVGPELMWGHTEADTLDKCWEHSLKPIGKYLELFLARYVADAKQFPFPREIPEEHRKKVREYFRGRCFGFVDD